MDPSEYNECKLKIKNWEKKFKEAEKRNPTKVIFFSLYSNIISLIFGSNTSEE